MEVYKTIAVILISIGIVIIILAIYITRKLIYTLIEKYEYDYGKQLKRNWKRLLYIMFFFLICFFIAIYIISTNHYGWLAIMTSNIFLLGAIFVLLVIITGLNTFKVLKKSNVKLLQQKRRLKSNSEEFNQFVYITSHDLQEPLGVVKSFIPLLKKEYGEKIGDQGRVYLEFISKAGDRMSGLIHGLLEFCRIGKNANLSRVDFNVLLNEVLDQFSQKILLLHAEINAFNLLPTLNVYEKEIKSLLYNLIDNALKYKKPDEIPKINVYAADREEYWEFLIEDNGVGIALEHQEKIFYIFQKLQVSKEDSVGIGLSHCKKIVALHHGDIWVESEQGEGSKFFFTISKKL